MNAVAKNNMSEVDPDIARAIQTALETTDWRDATGWSDLAAIADAAAPTSLVIYPEAMSVDGNKVKVPADLTAHLTYNDPSEGTTDQFDQNFPALLKFIVKDGEATLDSIEIDLTFERP